jgi:probable F420-dependent oxidoreductase
MKLGVFGINNGPMADPEVMLRVAQAAEQAGFDSVWTGEHVVLPEPQAPPSPAPPDFPMLDPAVALAYLAAGTERLLLATGIVILPQRNPLVLAKEMASLDVVSKGRLVLGVGAGYLKAEFEALGAPFAERGAVTDEAIDAMRALWSEEQPRFAGRFFSFSGVNAFPRPVQKPGPPIVVGGFTRPAFRRALLRGQGWYGFAMDVEATRKAVAAIRQLENELERPPALGRLALMVTPPPAPIDRDGVARYAELGIERLILLPPASRRSADDLAAWVGRTAESLLR